MRKNGPPISIKTAPAGPISRLAMAREEAAAMAFLAKHRGRAVYRPRANLAAQLLGDKIGWTQNEKIKSALATPKGAKHSQDKGKTSRAARFLAVSQNWADIVGPSLSKYSFPDRLTGGQLTVRVVGAAAPLLVQRQEEIIGMIRLGGLDEVTKIKLMAVSTGALKRAQDSAQNEVNAPKKRVLTAAEQETIAAKFSKVADVKLRARLIDAATSLATMAERTTN